MAFLDKNYNAASKVELLTEFACSDKHAGFLQNHQFKLDENGRFRFPVEMQTPGMQSVTVRSKNGLEKRSNPALCTKNKPELSLYWGDMHGHSNLSDGRGGLDEYYSYARDVAGLDFSAVTDHDLMISYEQWDAIQNKAAEWTREGEFIAFNAYEWTSWEHGHRCIYYPDEKGPMFKCDAPDSDTPEKLYNLLKNENVIVVSHHPAGLGDTVGDEKGSVDWSRYDAGLQPVVEIFSSHGSFEHEGCPKKNITGQKKGSFVQDALLRGIRTGFIASSDSHDGHPGFCGPYQYHHKKFSGTSKGALTAVYCPEKSRREICNALKARRCYATTGVRMIVSFSVNGNTMGEAYKASMEEALMERKIYTRVVGTDKIKKIEVVRNNNNVYTHHGTGEIEEFEWIDRENQSEILISSGTDQFFYYYLRVTQVDGEMAWASPVWFVIDEN